MTASIRVIDAGGWAVDGDMNLASAERLLEQARQTWGGTAQLVLDLGGVGRIDSCALAMLLEWSRAARARGGALTVRNVPEPLRSIARLCGVEDLLALGGAAARE
ncbi:MAG: lipid asymmetry maintenance protein MlaB [Gammaproteobacteria bacterium]